MKTQIRDYQVKLIHHEKQTIVILACLLVILPLSVLAQSKQELESKAKVMVWADWDCLSLHYPKYKLRRVVQAALRQIGDEWSAKWGDRAFAFDLNGDGKTEYIIPLGCGAVGNCDWGIFVLNPSRLVGIVNGENIYVRQRVKHWSALTVYIHDSCCDGHLDTYVFRKGRYEKLPGEYYVMGEVSMLGPVPGGKHPYPKFMKNTPLPCASKKSKQKARR